MVLDTNILILFSKGDQSVCETLAASTEPYLISRISYIEFLADKQLTLQERNQAKQFLLKSFTIVDINYELSDAVIALRSQTNLKIPDAIIVATALKQNDTLYTFDRQIQQAVPEVVYPA